MARYYIKHHFMALQFMAQQFCAPPTCPRWGPGLGVGDRARAARGAHAAGLGRRRAVARGPRGLRRAAGARRGARARVLYETPCNKFFARD